MHNFLWNIIVMMRSRMRRDITPRNLRTNFFHPVRPYVRVRFPQTIPRARRNFTSSPLPSGGCTSSPRLDAGNAPSSGRQGREEGGMRSGEARRRIKATRRSGGVERRSTGGRWFSVSAIPPLPPPSNRSRAECAGKTAP